MAVGESGRGWTWEWEGGDRRGCVAVEESSREWRWEGVRGSGRERERVKMRGGAW